MRRLKEIVTDERLPKWLRRLAVVGLLPIPGPFDEVILGVVGVIIAVRYRDVLRRA